jgi:predicted transposase/invertase (TIGR01784 family)
LTYWATITTAEKKGIDIGRAEGMAEGRAEGRAEGETQKAIDIALNLKNEGLDPAVIARTTGLSQEEIERLE